MKRVAVVWCLAACLLAIGRAEASVVIHYDFESNDEPFAATITGGVSGELVAGPVVTPADRSASFTYKPDLWKNKVLAAQSGNGVVWSFEIFVPEGMAFQVSSINLYGNNGGATGAMWWWIQVNGEQAFPQFGSAARAMSAFGFDHELSLILAGGTTAHVVELIQSEGQTRRWVEFDDIRVVGDLVVLPEPTAGAALAPLALILARRMARRDRPAMACAA